jgi:hypothetical protein
MHRLLSFTISFGLLSLTLAAAFAGGPAFWRVATRADIERGDAQGVSIADNGALTLAPAFTEVFDTKQAYVWSVAADGAGNVYLGTGHEGRVFKVDAAGKGSLLYKTTELDVMALATDARGNVYAGTSPDGKVYRITPGGEARVFFEPKTKYIWSLAFDKEGRLLVGTGDKGVIYRVNPDGKGAPLVTTTQTNITALAVDASGNIIAGTDPGGLILRVTPDGKAFTLFDSAQREVRDLALGKDGAVYALALAESAGSGAANAAAAAPATAAPSVISADEGVTVTISDVQVIDSSTTTAAASARSGEQSKSALYRIDQSGVTDLVWDSRDVTAFGVVLDEASRALVGTGQKGRVYAAPAEARGVRKPTLVVQSSEAQTSRFVRTPQGQLYAASSNLGKLFRLGRETVASGTYTSAVRDAQSVATWGRVSWVGEGDIEVQTRSGNTASPDSTWSEWSAAFKTPDGGQVASPRARYVQWRATLKRGAGGVAPSLREVTLSYLPRNLAPAISGLSVLPVGVALQAMPQQQADTGAEQAGLDPAIFGAVAQMPPRKLFQKGAISLQWTADDRNGDNLEYAVHYRAANATEYYPLKTGLKENFYTVDANALPDGRYVFKVVASDAASNPGALALADEEETEPVEVDNTAPTVTAGAPRLEGNSVEVVFQANDATSVIRRAEYQVDGGEWKPVFPVDGIADARREEFSVKVSLPDARPHSIALRVFDANANVGSAQAAVRKGN